MAHTHMPHFPWKMKPGNTLAVCCSHISSDDSPSKRKKTGQCHFGIQDNSGQDQNIKNDGIKVTWESMSHGSNTVKAGQEMKKNIHAKRYGGRMAKQRKPGALIRPEAGGQRARKESWCSRKTVALTQTTWFSLQVEPLLTTKMHFSDRALCHKHYYLT